MVFWPALAVWSWLLVKPQPFAEIAQVLASWAEVLAYLASKTLHLTGYAGFLFLAAAGFSPRWRRWTIPLVVLHGPLSELAQYYGTLWFDTGRTGTVRDVLIDWFGMALGYGAWVLVRRSKWWGGRPGEATETGGVEPVRPAIGENTSYSADVFRDCNESSKSGQAHASETSN